MKNLLTMLLAIVLTVSLVSCGTTAPQPSGEAPVVSSTPSQSQPTVEPNYIGQNLKYDLNAPVNEEKDITIKFWSSADHENLYKTWLGKYSEIHPNVKFDISVYSHDDLFKKLGVSLQSGTGPDLFHMHPDQAENLVGNMVALPEDIFPKEALRADFAQVDAFIRSDGNLYFMPSGIMTAGMFYNKKLWAEAGLTDNDIPKTWDKFIEAGKKLTQKDANGQITVAGLNFNTYAQFMLTAMNEQSGLFAFEKDGLTPTLDDPISVKNMQFIYDLYNVHGLGSEKLLSNVEAFGNQQAAIIYCWGWIGRYLNQNFPDVEFGFFPSPTFDGKVPPAYDENGAEATPGISKKASPEAQAVGLDVLKYLLAEDGFYLDAAKISYMAPAKFSLASHPDILGDPALKGQMDILDRTIFSYFPQVYSQNYTTFVGENVMLNHKDPAASLKEAKDIIKNELEKINYQTPCRKYKYASEMVNN